MNAEEALSIIETVLSNERLNKLQATILRDTWNDLPYQETARKLGYELGYVKQTGSQLWRSLSTAFGEKVSKANLHAVIKRHLINRAVSNQEANSQATTPEAVSPRWARSPMTSTRTLTDWGEAADVSIFYGRNHELATLERWTMRDRCRLVGLFGMGGIGKTALSIKLAQQVIEAGGQTAVAFSPQGRAENELIAPFEFVIWRSLRNAPPIRSLMADLILFLSQRQETVIPDRLDQQILQLLDYLRRHRCLLILDNAETVMQPGDRDGGYLPGYEGYGHLLRCVGETEHQSCLILTSREKPKGFAPKEGETLPVRSLQLTGLPATIGRELFQFKGQFSGTTADWHALVNQYAGNPLALKIVATAIADFFDGSIARFLEFSQQGNSIFGDIRDLLARQIGRLSDLEQQVMVWLAINREPTSFTTLQADCFPPVLPTQLLDTLTALERRSLIEKRGALFTLLPAVMEYITEWLITQVCVEIEQISAEVAHPSRSQSSPTHHPSPLHHYALVKATAKDYIRETQIRLIVQPLLQRLRKQLDHSKLDQRLMQLVAGRRGQSAAAIGYSGGNVINLLCQLVVDLSQRDFSHLILWQAYLRKVPLHGTSLAHSDLTNCAFTETFSQILSVTFSADGTLLAASDISYDVHVWRVADGKKVLTCKSQEGWVWAVAFSPDHRLLASSANGTIHLWDIETGACLQTFYNYTSRVFALAFSPDGNYLASGNEDHQIHFWQVATGERVATLNGHSNEIHAIAFSPNGRLLASGSYDKTVKVWEIPAAPLSASSLSTTAKFTLNGHTHWVESVAFSPDGHTLASSSRDCTIKLWSVNTGDCQNTLTGHTHPIYAIACAPYPTDTESPPGNCSTESPYLLISGSGDQTVRLWNNNGECIRVLQGHTSWVSSVAISPDGLVIASGSEDQSVRLWDSRTNHCLKVLQGYNSGVWSVAFSPDGQQLVSGGQDRLVHAWKIDAQKRPEQFNQGQLTAQPYPGHTSWIWSVAYSPDGATLASGSEDSTIRLWQISPQQTFSHPHQQQILTGHTHAVWSVAFSPDGAAIASGSLDGTLRLWERETGTCQHILHQHQSGVWSVAFAPQHPLGKANCHLLASGSQDQTICLWEIGVSQQLPTLSVKPLKTLKGHTSWIRCIVFNPSGHLLASSSSDGTVKLWQVETGECIQTWKAHNSLVLAVTFSPDGTILATGGGDGSVKLWEVPSLLQSPALYPPVPLRSLQGHEKWLRCLAYHPNGDLLASCSQDGSVKLWDWRSGICLDTLRLPRPYEGANITGITGLTEAQKDTLKLLGAVDQ